MNALIDEVTDVACQVWSTVTGLEPLPAGPSREDLTVAGSVQISGEWNGAVIVSMTWWLARTVTGHMFERNVDDLAADDVADAVGEIANMIGGNIKALLPGPTQLSIPIVVSGGPAPKFPGTEVVQRLHFSIDGEPFDLTLVEVAAEPVGDGSFV